MKQEMKDFEWLAGKWHGNAGKSKVVEQWETGNGILEGQGYFISEEGDEIPTEKLRIEKIAGHIIYIAVPRGQSPTLFTLINSDNSTYIFENKEHDFPQRITYTKINDNEFTAIISSMDGSKSMEFNFTLNK